MDDLDFMGTPPAKPAPPPKPAAAPAEPASLYQPRLALEFFKLGGSLEQFPAGKQIFAENDKTGGLFSKGARIYLLLDGDVMLTRGGKPLDLVPPGEIFGEMAAIAEAPRSATATARKNCRVLSLDEKQFQSGLAKNARVRPDADERHGPAPAPRRGAAGCAKNGRGRGAGAQEHAGQEKCCRVAARARRSQAVHGRRRARPWSPRVPWAPACSS
jgi:CRP/FNR family cyclic AMP-dependent transcriptional regulator